MMDKFREECGVFGIYGNPEAANLTYLGLYALQHRGQESAGIATSDGKVLQLHKAVGYVADNFTQTTFARLAGTSAIGHVRYSTAGESHLQNAQPFLIDCAHGQIAVAHNGNIVNARELRDELVRNGAIFQTSSDTEVVLHLYARSKAQEAGYGLETELAEPDGALVGAAAAAMEGLEALARPLAARRISELEMSATVIAHRAVAARSIQS